MIPEHMKEEGMNFSPEARKMVEYLSGSLPDEERVRMQERLFLDEEFCDTMRAAEDDLLDGYARGQLTESDRSRVEALLRESPAVGTRLSFARALQQRIGTRAVPRKRWTPVLGWALAAVLAGVVVWTGFSIRDLRTRLLRTESRLRLGESSHAAPGVASIVIWPGTLRDEADRQTFASFSDAELVRLTLPCQGLRTGQSASAELSLESGAVVWREDAVPLRELEKTLVAQLLIPAARLGRGRYRLVLRQQPDGVEEYRFRIR